MGKDKTPKPEPKAVNALIKKHQAKIKPKKNPVFLEATLWNRIRRRKQG